MIRKKLRPTGIKVGFRQACTAFRLAAAISKPIQSFGAPENYLVRQEHLDERELWMEGLDMALYSQNVDAFHALFGGDKIFQSGKLHIADSPPRLLGIQQKAARARLDIYGDNLIKKVITNFLEPEWKEWHDSMNQALQTFRYNERVDLSIDPDWPVNTCDLVWVNSRIRNLAKDGRREWWRNFHKEGLIVRFKTRRLARLAIILKALMQVKTPHSSLAAIEPFPSLYDQEGMRESVTWLKEVSVASDPPSDRDLLGRPECVQSVCKNLPDLKNLYCHFALASEKGVSDHLYITLNPEEEADLIKKRITVKGLTLVGNIIADSNDQLQLDLADQFIYSNIIHQANVAEFRASGIRPGPAGIEFSNAFLEVCVHANASRVLRLPLPKDFDLEDHEFSGDAEINFWEEMKRLFQDSGLQEAAYNVCEGKVSDEWDLRNTQFWTEVWSRRGGLDVKMFVPCKAHRGRDSELGKRPHVDSTESTSDEVG
jgi:hypothetical protein